MAHLKSYAYEGRGQTSLDEYWYTQAIRVGDRIECAGQGMVNPKRKMQLEVKDSYASIRWMGTQERQDTRRTQRSD